MFFDTSTAGQEGQIVARQEGVHFVDGFASPDRYMAVINYNLDGGLKVSQNFTTDPALVKNALNSIQGSRTSNTTSAQVGSTNTKAGQAAAKGPAVVTAQNYRMMLASLRSVAESLASIKGRKALVFFSGGAAVSGDIGPDLVETVAACNRANVAIYTVGAGPGGDGGGAMAAGSATSSSAPPKNTAPTRNNNPLASPDSTDMSSVNAGEAIPHTLSDGTGGISFLTTNDLANQLGKVAQEQDEYYLIGYAPTTDAPEGSCHELRLKLDRGGLEVRARKDYCTAKSSDPLLNKPAGKDLEARAAGSAPGNIATHMEVPWFYTEPNVAQVKLAVDITPPAMKLQKDKGKLHGEFDLAAVAYKPDGSVAARFSDAVKLDFDNQQQADAFQHSLYHYENQLDVAPGQYNLRLAVSAGAQDFGKTEMPLTVDPWNGQTLSASAIALSRNAHANADIVAGLDGSLLEQRSRPLIANGTEVVPTGSDKFHTGERGFFYIEAYEPLLTATKPGTPLPIVGIRIRVLDRASGQAKQDSGIKTAEGFMHPGSPVVPIVSALPTATLPAGPTNWK